MAPILSLTCSAGGLEWSAVISLTVQTQVSSCVQGSGPRCDRCSPGFYGDLTLPGARCEGCPCNNNIDREDRDACDSLTGECLRCLHNTMGSGCQDCKPGYYGNALVQDCKACDCNLEGTERPSCDPETGECICRTGVTGIFCDECAVGYSSEFPACKECHPCTTLWTENVTDVQRAAQRMRTFIPRHGDNLRPGDSHHRQRMLEMHSRLDSLTNLTGLSLPKVEKVEKLCMKIGKLKDAIDPNTILIDLSPLLNTEIDNIGLEFKKLLNNLKEKLIKDPDDEDEGDLEDLAMEIEALVRLNQKVCGGPGLDDCSGCGGALCGLDLGKRKCGGPNCDGVISVSERASEMAEKAKDQLITLPSRLEESKNKINDAKQAAQDTKDQAKDLQDQISNHMNSLEREKSKTRKLIQQVKDYLMDEMVPPEDIEKMARAVLAIQLPRSPAKIQSMINDINNLLSNTTHFQDDLKNLEEHAKTAQDLLQKAQELKERSKDIDVTQINRDIYESEKAQNKANDDLEAASRDRDMTKDRLPDIKDKLDDIETKLMNRRPENLLNEIEALKKKTEQNRDMAELQRPQAKRLADTELDYVKLLEAKKRKLTGFRVKLENPLKKKSLRRRET
ncbi:laminin subunit beta-4-like isoform X1 [Lates japonicus]|uniref:Laminin subunit beta-4-like isoform X1 n=1 Tax=Lates japonicus TaxID=270547 RepID=A0AAD3NHF8_LATJO|nr:laminin subunit beta-4-like isoform X1 [Lates japonicus]